MRSDYGWFSDRGSVKLSSQEEDNVQRLLFLVTKAVEDFMLKKNGTPYMVVFNNEDVILNGVTEVIGYKVSSSPYVTKGQVIVCTEEVKFYE